jgi:hypothetical protein
MREGGGLELGVVHAPKLALGGCGLLVYKSYSLRASRTLYRRDAAPASRRFRAKNWFGEGGELPQEWQRTKSVRRVKVTPLTRRCRAGVDTRTARPDEEVAPEALGNGLDQSRVRLRVVTAVAMIAPTAAEMRIALTGLSCAYVTTLSPTSATVARTFLDALLKESMA